MPLMPMISTFDGKVDIQWLSIFLDIPPSIIKFGVNAYLDILPTPNNLKTWNITRKILISKVSKKIIIGELTCPMEHGVEESQAFKMNKYCGLPKLSSHWSIEVLPFEISARGIVCSSWFTIVKEIGLSKKVAKKIASNLSVEVLKASQQIFLARDRRFWNSVEE